MRHYCTLFDRNYLARGLALHRSLMRHGGEFSLHVLCLDEATLQALSVLSLPHTELVSIRSLEEWDRELREARSKRTAVEYYFTCKPVLLAYALDGSARGSRLTYLDSDLYYFSNPSTTEDLAGNGVALSPHRFSGRNTRLAPYGDFNAGWVSVNDSQEARRFIGWWRDRCIEWCGLALEDTRFGDQKYLNQVPSLFPGTAIISHPGVNLGPWNLDPRTVQLSGGEVKIAGHPLVVFHFHAIRRMLFNIYDCGLYEYGVELSPEVKGGIYRPYLSELADCERQASALLAAKRPFLGITALARQFALTVRTLARHTAVHAAA